MRIIKIRTVEFFIKAAFYKRVQLIIEYYPIILWTGLYFADFYMNSPRPLFLRESILTTSQDFLECSRLNAAIYYLVTKGKAYIIL